MPASAHDTKDRVLLDWKRDPKSAPRRVDAPVPAPPEVPPELQPPTGAPQVEASRVAPPPGTASMPAYAAAAARAGEEAAREASQSSGFREYWRAGFSRGIDAALEDPRLGAWDREEGRRAGRRDPRVRTLGDHLANESAVGVADHDAEARVRTRFMDLSSEPRRDRADSRGRPAHGAAPRFDGPYGIEPVLDDVFIGFPPSRYAGLSREGRRAIGEWRVEPAYFTPANRHGHGYDARWKDCGAVFARWRDRQRRDSIWVRLNPAERERFRAIFCERFEQTLRSIDMRNAQAAWRTGFADGWHYGAEIQAEWSYRRGYAEGFDQGVGETAAIAFPYAYDRAYSESYERWFDDWSRTAHPGLDAVRLADESGDGVFEPGERVSVEADVVNYGGGFGNFELIASGDDVGPASRTQVRLVGRGRLAGSQRLSLRVGDRVAIRTRSDVIVTIADARVDAPLYVSRPLEFDGNPTIDADRLQGRVVLNIGTVNTSRRAAAAVLRVERLTDAGAGASENLGSVPAGGSRRAAITLTGIHPLDLIGGEARWRASIVRGSQVDDVKEIRIAAVATDLTNPDLMDFMIALAKTPEVSRSDVADARDLMMDRLRADWERAGDLDGNPYKRDYDTEGSETVLGQLVRVTHGGGRNFDSPQVFAGMGRDVEALADDLPGAHPLLRKWMKKLAKRLS